MTIQIAICDDDKNELKFLQKLIEEIMEEYTITYKIYEFNSGEQLLKSNITCHLAFLDIIMTGKNGIEIGNVIFKKNRNTKIIYQTNYSQYWKEAINYSHAFAFLEKPLKKHEVEEQLKEFIESSAKYESLQIQFRNVKFQKNDKEVEREIINLSVNSIIYFMYVKSQKRIKIVTQEGMYIYKDTMKALEARMKPLGFEVSCRGILVNLSKVMKIKRYAIIMNNGNNIALSQKRVAVFKERMNEYIHDSLK